MKTPWKYIFVSFFIGLVAGGSVGLYYSHRLAHHWINKAPEMFLRRLDHDLHLNETQRAEILVILKARRDKIIAYEEEARKSSRTEIRTHLTPEQQTQFDAIVAKHDAERRKRESQ